MVEGDLTNLSSSSPHRLPTRSAAEVLQNLTELSRPITTSLPSLDSLLQRQELRSGASQQSSSTGVSRGQITEIYGPPGAGKTTLAIQLAANALCSGDAVVWADSSHTVAGPRLESIVSHAFAIQNLPAISESMTKDGVLDSFYHFHVPTLPHLLALLIYPSDSFPPLKTSLIVVDSVSSLFTLAFPKAKEKFFDKPDSAKKKDDSQWAASRRWAVMSDFISKVGKLAATKNIAILLISQTTTRIRANSEAVLRPAISGTAWENGINNRLVLFRDWLWNCNEGSSQGNYIPKARFAGVAKAGGVTYDGLSRVVPFATRQHGIEEIQTDPKKIELHAAPSAAATSTGKKRKREGAADSQSDDEEVGSDEEFGWLGNDDPLNTEELAE